MSLSDPFPPAATLPPPVLVGREREQQRLGALLAAATSGRGCLVLVGGEAGIGKSALVRALVAEATTLGATVAAGHCYDLSATPPYGPWRELLARLPSDDGAPPLPAELIDAGAPALGGETGLFQKMHDVLADAAASRPTVGVLEDLHWADQASLDLLRFLARRLASLPLLLVATYRADELTRRHPLAQLLPTLVREAPTERLDLRRLDEVALRDLVAVRYPLPAEAEARLVDHLQRGAEGNPFYAQELLRDLEEERVLAPGEPQWTLGDLARVRVPALLQQVVERRLARLGEAARDRLAVAAVIGQQVPIAVWQASGGLTEDEVLQTVDRAVEAHLLEAGDDGSAVGFAHALVREVLYEDILPPRRRVWHRRVAEVTAALPTPDPDAVAYHFGQAGDTRAADWLVRAGERALRTYAWLTAHDRFAAAVGLLESDAGRTGERGWLLYRMGRMLRMGDPARGIGYLEEAERVAHAIGDPVLAAYALFDRGLLLCIQIEVDRGLATMEAGMRALKALPADHLDADPAVAILTADSLSLAEIALAGAGAGAPRRIGIARSATLAEWLAEVGRFAEARTLAERFLAQVATIDHPDSLMLAGIGDAEFALGDVEAAMGRPAEARAAYRQAREAYRAIDHHFVFALVVVSELWGVLAYSTVDIAARRNLVAHIAEAWARAAGALPPILTARQLELDVLILEGAWTEVEAVARPVLDADESLPQLPRDQALLALGVLARLRGEPAEAWRHLDAGLPNGLATEPGSHPFRQATAIQRMATDLALDAGDLPTAATWLEAHDAWLAWSGAVRGKAEGQCLWARYYCVAGDPARAREHAIRAASLAAAPTQPLVLLAVHRLLGELATETAGWDEAESRLGESLALAEACAAPFERALTLVALADLRAAENKMSEAIRLLAEVRAVGEPLGAVPLLARANALMTRLAALPTPADPGPRLSVREAEVLRLVAAGQSNPEIAQDLFISPRTVTTHLTHIFAKLGVDGRAEAAACAIRGGLI
ncbi:MAG: AAA family ATPase [Thermomicrobiales bacterium]